MCYKWHYLQANWKNILKSLSKNTLENITNIEHTSNETGIDDLDVSSSFKKFVSANNKIGRSPSSNSTSKSERLNEDINEALEDEENETKRYKRRNNIDRIAEYPNGFDG